MSVADKKLERIKKLIKELEEDVAPPQLTPWHVRRFNEICILKIKTLVES